MATCAVCGGPVEESEAVKCSVCGAPMHRQCASDEPLLDAEENPLCPYDAALAALDWFDAVVTSYLGSIDSEKRRELSDRLRSYIDLLESEAKQPR